MSDKYLSGIDLSTGKIRPVQPGDIVVTSDHTPLAGATGLAGSRIQGATGLVGLQGATGILGATGLQAATGLRGLTGLRGPTGIQGFTGIIGPTGLRGATGTDTGQTGIAGVTGSQGYFNYSYIYGSTNIVVSEELIAIDGTSGGTVEAVTLTLPVRASTPVGKKFIFFNEGITYSTPPFPQSTATIATQGGDTLNGGTSYVMNLSAKETVYVYNNGVEYTASFFRRGATGLLVGETGIMGVTGISGTTGIQGVTGL